MTNILDPTQARRRRWRTQLLGGSSLTPVEVVDRAVALQGQDLPAVLRAITLRAAPGTTIADVRAAFDRGDLVRSWPMRGTLFVTTPAHLAALRSLTAERSHRQAARRRHELGLEDAVVAQARDALVAALEEKPRRRSEAMALWEAAGIATDAGRGYHLIAHLAIDGVVHWGAFDETGAEQLLTLTASASAVENPLPDLLRGYLTARAPATEADAAWWFKLPKSDIRRAATDIDDLQEEEVDGQRLWTIADRTDPGQDDLTPTGVTLVPGFDEWILGYADRSLVTSPAAFEALVPGGNGVFRPAVLVDGVVVGSWRIPASRSARKPAEPVVHLVEDVTPATRRAIDDALDAWPYG